MEDMLIEGCKAGDLSQVSHALQAGADLHCYGDSPMYYAATRGHWAVVQHLWIYADVPRVFHVGRGTLRKAAAHGHVRIVRFLACFATPSERDAARRAASAAGHADVVASLEAYDTPQK